MAELIPLLVPETGPEEIQAASEAIKSTWISGNGPRGKELEKQLAEYLNVKHVLLVNNCTSAMHLALMALGIDAGEVIIPNYTFTSTGLAPILVGARPVIAEIEFKTANLDCLSLEKQITPKTRAIIPVHYSGYPCDMDTILKISSRHGLKVIEDAAQAIGSQYKGKMAGTLGDVGCFSFHSVKNMTCGEGGALVTNSDEIFKKAIVMRDKGTDKYNYDLKDSKGFYEYISSGHNFMLSDILAAVALAQFKKLPSMNERRRKHAQYYLQELRNIPGLGLPEEPDQIKSNWHLFTVRTPLGKTDAFIDGMRERGVTANTQYVPLHMNSFYQNFGYKKGDFKVSEDLYRSLVRLPMYPALTSEDLQQVVTGVKEVMAEIS